MSFIRTIKSNGRKYQQLVESRWDPAKKQSRIHVIRHLGRVIEKDGEEKLIPAQLKIDSVDHACPVGELALFWKIAEEFGIEDCISTAVGGNENDTAKAILLLVLNQLIGRKSLTQIGKWVSETPIPRWADIEVEKLTKDYFLSALDKISNENGTLNSSFSFSIQNNIASKWRKIIGNEPEKFFFYQDITRIRWNGDQTYWAENGYGAQTGRPHLGFGLVVSKYNHMPVMGYPVRGSHPDSTTIKETIDNLSRWDMKNITLVWDRGFVSKRNINYTRKAEFHVLSAGSRSSKEVIDWTIKYSDHEIEQRTNILHLSKGNTVYFKEEIGNLYGKECKIVIMLNPQKRNHSRTERDLLLQKLESETSKQKIATLKKDLKPIVKLARGRRGYKIDETEEHIARRLDGRSLFFSTDTKLSGDEIIRTYFQKDHIEKAFRFLKGNACLSPVRYQLPGRVEVYLSVINFIAYELIAAVLWKIEKHKLNTTYEKLIQEAAKIYEVELTSKKSKIHRWTHVTKEVEKTLKPFNVLSLQT
jgi:transposase